MPAGGIDETGTNTTEPLIIPNVYREEFAA